VGNIVLLSVFVQTLPVYHTGRGLSPHPRDWQTFQCARNNSSSAGDGAAQPPIDSDLD
jgi:hypothetical protein